MTFVSAFVILKFLSGGRASAADWEQTAAECNDWLRYQTVIDRKKVAYEINSGLVKSQYPWFAVRVKSNCERTVAALLDQKGYQRFVPSCKVRTRWSDRTKTVDRILFPGYVFCSFNPLQRLPIVSTPGVLHVVGIGKEPAAVPEVEISGLWATLESGAAVGPWPYLRSGDWVIVERGAMAGVQGIVTQVKGSFRLVVSIGLLQRSIAAEIERDWVRPIRRAKVRTAPDWTAARISGRVA